MKKIKMIKYDECYLYATDECMEFKACNKHLEVMLSSMIASLYEEGHLTKEEIIKAVEFGLLDIEEKLEKVTKELGNLLGNIADEIKKEKPKEKATKQGGK